MRLIPTVDLRFSSHPLSPSTCLTRSAGLLLALLVAACGGTTSPPPGGGCGDGGACPAGQVCGSDGRCQTATNNDLGSGCPGGCTGAMPICDAKTGQCVGCLADGDCPAGKVCRQTQCAAGCSTTRPECAPDAGSCDVDLGVCRGCLADGDCQTGAPRCDRATGRCVACLAQGDNCPDGQYCDESGGARTCKAGCKTMADCGQGQGQGQGKDCCNHVCVDVTSDKTNCGTCGRSCGASSCCGGACADLASDVNNCGACAQACVTPGGNPLCIGSRCTVGSCQTGRLDCDGKAATGCEIDGTSDAFNCGACGQVCPLVAHGMGGCKAGKCGVGACDPGYADCDGMLNTGCEADLNKDASNCGACGQRCTSGAVCVAGKCALMCTGTRRDCDGDIATGCEVDVATDPNNCNGCGNVCNLVINGKPICTNGLCGMGCNTGYADCDKDPVNGCESQVASDPNNCGACGKKCTAMNGTAMCASSTCKITCDTNFGDCDNNTGNGCETDLRTANANCGACGKACGGSTPMCQAGACTGTIHNSIAFPSNYTTAGGCSYNNQHAIKWVNLGSMQWKQCIVEASKRGAMLASQNYTAQPGWKSNRKGSNAQYYNGSWSSYVEAAITSSYSCIIARDPVSTTNTATLANTLAYDGQTWHYTDYGSKYYDECQTLASNAGAMIITPYTIGLTGDGYWINSTHMCNTYEYLSCPTTCTMANDNLGSAARSTLRKCMVGYVDN